MTVKSKYMLIVALPMLMAGCHDNDAPEMGNFKPRPQWKAPVVEYLWDTPQWAAYLPEEEKRPVWAVDMTGNDSKPDWTAPDNNLYASSMTAVLAMPELLKPYQGDGDLIAAFIGDECRGIGDITIVNGQRYYFVNIKGVDTERGHVVFKYYCEQLQVLLSADDNLAFMTDMVYGTVSAPEIPSFEKSSKYPLQMTLNVNINHDLGGFKPAAGDMIAAFVGDDCRGVAAVTPTDAACRVQVLGVEADEPVDLYYYTESYKGVLLHKGNHIALQPGTEVSLTPSFMPVKGRDAYLQINNNLIKYDSDDARLSVFVDGVCRGYSFRQGDGLYHTMLLGEPDEMAVVRYYSDELSYIFESKPVLVADLLASSATNYTDVVLETKGHYPLTMGMLLSLPADLAATASEQDLIAAFVGSECRGVAEAVDFGGMTCYSLVVYNGVDDASRLVLRYYSSATGRIYQSAPYVFEHNKFLGWFDYPEYPYFTEIDE